MSKEDVRLLRWVGGVAAITGEDNCLPVIRRLVRKQDTPGALTEQHARIFTILTTNDECKDLIFHYLNLIRVRAGKSPLDETAEPVVVDNFLKAIKVLQHFNNQADALVQASNLFAFLQGESPNLAEDAFDKLLSQDPSTAMALFRTRNVVPADKMSLVKAAAAGNKIAILRLADTSTVPDVVAPDAQLLRRKEVELATREKALAAKVQALSSRFNMRPEDLFSDDISAASGDQSTALAGVDSSAAALAATNSEGERNGLFFRNGEAPPAESAERPDSEDAEVRSAEDDERDGSGEATNGDTSESGWESAREEQSR